MNRLLFELAAERQALHSKTGKNWILTIHKGPEVKKFAGKNYIVVALPTESEEAKVGLCTYVGQYNALTASLVDELCQRGKYAEGCEYYELLLHFDRCGGLARGKIQEKFDCLTRIVRNENPETNKRRFEELCIPLAAHWDLAQIETVEPLVVTNLLTVEIP